MTLSDILLECGELSVHSPRVEINMRGYVNRAIRYIANRHSYVGMHDVQVVTLLSGQTSVTMPSNFKELGKQQSPISFNYGQYRLPVIVTTRSKIESFGIWPYVNGPLSMPLPGSYVPIQVVFMEQNGPGGAWTLNVPPQFSVTQDLPYNVQGYFFPNELQKANDSNYFTTQPEIVEAVIARTKAIAYFAEDPTSKAGMAAQEQFEDFYTTSLYTDVEQSFNGVSMRM